MYQSQSSIFSFRLLIYDSGMVYCRRPITRKHNIGSSKKYPRFFVTRCVLMVIYLLDDPIVTSRSQVSCDSQSKVCIFKLTLYTNIKPVLRFFKTKIIKMSKLTSGTETN